MRALTRPALVLGTFLLSAVAVAPASAQDGPGHNHIGHVADGFRGTPEGAGLLPTAMMEAEVALQHATLAASGDADLAGMKRHAGHVLHALDASTSERGPGKGFGLIRALDASVQHIEMAAGTDGASEGVKTHTNHVASAARSASERAQRMKRLAMRIMESDDQAMAATAAGQLKDLAEQVLAGHDANGDDRTGWGDGEGGIEQAAMHLGLMKRGEGMGG